MIDKKAYNYVISAEHRLLDLHLRDAVAYRDLIRLFVRRDFTTTYKQTVLGPLWALIQPLLTTVVFTLVFGSLAGLTTADTEGSFVIPSFLFFMSGNICWGYFSAATKRIANTFLSNYGVMSKVYFPRIVMPIASSFTRLISFIIQFGIFLVLWAFFAVRGGTDIRITPQLLLVPLSVLQMMLLAIGCGTVLSAATAKYRDISMLIDFGLQLWQYASPIAYGLSLVSRKIPGLMWLYMLNPMTPVITTFRYAMFGFGYFRLSSYLISWAVTAVLFFFGLILYNRAERTFLDTI